MPESAKLYEAPQPVASRVLAAFVEAVGEQPDLAEVAQRLRDRVLAKNDLSETAFREALFGGDDS